MLLKNAAACITRNFLKNQELINESGFKSREAYNGARTVSLSKVALQFEAIEMLHIFGQIF